MCHSPLTHPHLHAQRQPILSYTLNLRLSDVLRCHFLHRHHRKVFKTQSHCQIPYYQGILKLFLFFLYNHPELSKRVLNTEKTIRLELERRKQHENKSRIIFWCLKRVSSAQDGRREKFKTVLESPGNRESMFLKLFYDACERNDDVKCQKTPMCGARSGERDNVIDVAHRGQGYSNTLEIWRKGQIHTWAPVANVWLTLNDFFSHSS